MIKTFISYDNAHKNKKNEIQKFINQQNDMQDTSLDYPIYSENNEYIRQKIRDEYITEATVLVLIATIDAKGRKFIDWEIAAAMYDGSKRKDGKRNDICGIVVIDYVQNNIRTKSNPLQQSYDFHTGNSNWITLSKSEVRNKYDYLPQRIVESIAKGAEIQIIPSDFVNSLLPKAIKYAHQTKNLNKGKYIYTDLRKSNSPRKELLYF